MMAPEPPEDFVQPPNEIGVLKAKLLDAIGDSVVIMAALRGAGAHGETRKRWHTTRTSKTLNLTASSVELSEKAENLLSMLCHSR
jgi:hypothetical protein